MIALKKYFKGVLRALFYTCLISIPFLLESSVVENSHIYIKIIRFIKLLFVHVYAIQYIQFLIVKRSNKYYMLNLC